MNRNEIIDKLAEIQDNDFFNDEKMKKAYDLLGKVIDAISEAE